MKNKDQMHNIRVLVLWILKGLILFNIGFLDINVNLPFPPCTDQHLAGVLRGISQYEDITKYSQQGILFILCCALAIDVIVCFLLKKLNVRNKILIFFYILSPYWNFELYIARKLIPSFAILLFLAGLLFLSQRFRYRSCAFGILLCNAAIILMPELLCVVPIITIYMLRKSSKICAGLCCTTMLISFFLHSYPMKASSFFDFKNSIETAVIIAVFLLVFTYIMASEFYFFTSELLALFILLTSVSMSILVPWNSSFCLIFIVIYIWFYKNVYDQYFFYGMIFCIENIFGIIISMQLFDVSQNLMFFFLSVQMFVFYLLFERGVKTSTLYKHGISPFVIGIGGDSGAGKSTLLNLLDDLLNDREGKVFLEGDGDHRWERTDHRWNKYTALNPDANYLYRQAYDIIRLKKHGRVFRTDYDHATGKFTTPHKIKTGKYIVLSGLHALFLPLLRKELDLKIYLDTDVKLQKFWKIKRDMIERGYSMDEIALQIEKRQGDVEKYIHPQKKYADLVLSFFDATLIDCTKVDHNELLSLRITISIENNLEFLLEKLRMYGVSLHTGISEDFNWQTITISGESLRGKTIDFEKIAKDSIPLYEELFNYIPKWADGINGIAQLFLIVAIGKKMRTNS